MARHGCDYVHLHPVRAGLLRSDDSLAAHSWSSMTSYSAAREHRPSWLCADRLLGAHGIPQDTSAGRAEFQLRIEARPAEEQDEPTLQKIRQSWSFGSEQVQVELLRRLEGKLGEHHSGELHRQTSSARAERIITEELARLGWIEATFATQRKNAPEKLAIAARLRKETTLTVRQIAQRVGLGKSKGANTNLHRFMQRHRASPVQTSQRPAPIGI